MNTEKKKQIIIPLVFESYLAAIKNSVGSKIFRNYYCKIEGRKTEILRNGDLSCAFFVSSILVIFDFAKKTHATVGGTIRELEKIGWQKIKKPKKGSVIVWSAKKFKNGESHRHIGFFIGNGKAISNDYKKGSPQIHDWDYRPIEGIFWNPDIEKM